MHSMYTFQTACTHLENNGGVMVVAETLSKHFVRHAFNHNIAMLEATLDIRELQACMFSFMNLNFAKCCLRAKLKAEHSLSVLWLKMHGFC